MITPDFSDRNYTAEVIKTKSAAEIFTGISERGRKQSVEEHVTDTESTPIKVYHGFLSTPVAYHRYPRTVKMADGGEMTIPRTHRVREKDHNLYDVLVAQCGQHIVVAVPFHDLAEEFFFQAHESLTGKGLRYEKLDITALVMQISEAGGKPLTNTASGEAVALAVTRCHLSYADQSRRTTNLQQVRISGTNLSVCEEYKALIQPVLDARRSAVRVTPTVLGFALLVDGVRKSSATTDSYGNFKVWVAPGLRRLIRLFWLLKTLEEMQDVTSTTGNLPILLSGTIRGQRIRLAAGKYARKEVSAFLPTQGAIDFSDYAKVIANRWNRRICVW
jgi:hypothetical protein